MVNKVYILMIVLLALMVLGLTKENRIKEPLRKIWHTRLDVMLMM